MFMQLNQNYNIILAILLIKYEREMIWYKCYNYEDGLAEIEYNNF